MQAAALFEEKIVMAQGHAWVTIRVELGGDGGIDATFEGREAPTVTYQFNTPEEANAFGTVLLRAAEIARRSMTMEAG